MPDTPASIARLAAAGAMLVSLRSFLTQMIGLGGTIVLTRSLSPREFGLIAFGLAVTAFATAFADVGLAAGLIRSSREPTRVQLRSALGLQVASMTALAFVIGVAIVPFGTGAHLTMIMLLSLPIAAWQTPARVLLERRLAYRRLSAIEFIQSAVYWAAVSAAVLSTAGIWGVAAASVLQTAIASALLLLTVPEARFRPLYSWRESRALFGFGAAFQAVNLTNVLRDQGLNFAVAGILGMPALGVWNVASRVLRVPMMLFGAVWRVSYPSMARIVREDPRPRVLLERAVALAALACGALLTPLAAAGPIAVPVVFGERWAEAGNVLVPVALALMIGGPVSLAVGGYLYAAGAVRTVLSSVVWHTVAWFVVTLPLLPILGVFGVGIGHIAGASVDALILARGARTISGAAVLRPLALPLASAILAGSGGYCVSQALGASFAAVAASALAALALYLTLVLAAVALGAEVSLQDVGTLFRRDESEIANAVGPTTVSAHVSLAP